MKIKNLKLGKRIASLAAASIILMTGSAQAVNNKSNYPFLAANQSAIYNQDYKFNVSDLTYSLANNIYTERMEDGIYRTTIISTDQGVDDLFQTFIQDDLGSGVVDTPEWCTVNDFDLSFLGTNSFNGINFTEQELMDIYNAKQLIRSKPVIYSATKVDEGSTVNFNIKMTVYQYDSFLDNINLDLGGTIHGINNYKEQYTEVAASYNHEYDTGIVTTNYHTIFKMANLLTQNTDLKYVNYRIDISKNDSGENIYRLFIDYNLEDEEIETKKVNVVTGDMDYVYQYKGNMYDLGITLPTETFTSVIDHSLDYSYSIVNENSTQKLLRHEYTTDYTKSEYRTKLQKKENDPGEVIFEYPLDDFVVSVDDNYVPEPTVTNSPVDTVDLPKFVDFELNGKTIQIPNVDAKEYILKNMKFGEGYPQLNYQAMIDSTIVSPTTTLYLPESVIRSIQEQLDRDNPLGLVMNIGSQVTGKKPSVYLDSPLLKDIVREESNYYEEHETVPFYTYTPREGDKVLTFFNDVDVNNQSDAISYLIPYFQPLHHFKSENQYAGSPFIKFNIEEEYKIVEEYLYNERHKYVRLPGNYTFKDVNKAISNGAETVDHIYSTRGANQVYSSVSKSDKFASIYSALLLPTGEYIDNSENLISGSSSPIPYAEKGMTIDVDTVVCPSLSNGVCSNTSEDGCTAYHPIEVREDGLGAFYYRFDAYYEPHVIHSKPEVMVDDNLTYDFTDGNGHRFDDPVAQEVSGTKNDYDFYDEWEEYDDGNRYMKYQYNTEKVYAFPSSKTCLEEYGAQYDGFTFQGKQEKISVDDFLLGTFGAVVGEGLFKDYTADQLIDEMKPSLDSWAKSHIINQDYRIEFEQTGNNIYAKIYIINNKGYKVTGKYTTNKPVYLYSIHYTNKLYNWCNTNRIIDHSKLKTILFDFQTRDYSSSPILHDDYHFYPRMTVIIPQNMEEALQNLEPANIDTTYFEYRIDEPIYEVTFTPTLTYEEIMGKELKK